MSSELRAQPLAGRTIAILCDFAFEGLEVLYPKIRLEEEGASITVVGIAPAGTKYTGKFGYPIKSDKTIGEVSGSEFDALILPGGFCPDYMRRNAAMLALTSAMVDAKKPVAAICPGPWMLCSARRADGSPVVKGQRCTSFIAIKDDVVNAGGEWVDEAVVVSADNMITARTPADLTPWCHAIIDAVVAQAAS